MHNLLVSKQPEMRFTKTKTMLSLCLTGTYQRKTLQNDKTMYALLLDQIKPINSEAFAKPCVVNTTI